MGSVERNIAALNLIRIAQCLNLEVGALFPEIKTLTADKPKESS